MNKYLKYIISFPKTLLFNIKVFELRDAIRLPVYICYNVKLSDYSKGCIVINDKVSFAKIKIGMLDGSLSVPKTTVGGGNLCIRKGSKLIFNGNADLATGISIRVEQNGIIEFGKNFVCNKSCFFASCKEIHFGDDCILGWNVNIRDVDGHNIYECNGDYINRTNHHKAVYIGNHVWIAAFVDILKGAKISDDSIVAYRSCVIKKHEEKNSLIGGYPAKIIRNNLYWEK